MPWTSELAQLPTPTSATLISLDEVRVCSTGSSSGQLRCRRPLRRRIPLDHPRAELGEPLRLARRAGVVRGDPQMLGCEAEGYRHVEIREGLHLPIEPLQRIGPEAVRPGETGAQVPYAEALHPRDGIVEPRVVEVKPLHEPHLAGIFGEMLECLLRRPVFSEQAHVEMTVIAGAFGLAMTRRGAPAMGQVEEAVPEDAGHPTNQQLGGAIDPEDLHLFGPEA